MNFLKLLELSSKSSQPYKTYKMNKIETIEQIDSLFKQIKDVKNVYYRYDEFITKIRYITITPENVSYVLDKMVSLHQESLNGYNDTIYMNYILSNPTFKYEYIYKYPDLPWSFQSFDVSKFDKNFIISYIDKPWHFHCIFEKKILSFEEIKNNLHHRIFAYNCGEYFNNLMDYEDFDMNILHNENIRTGIPFHLWKEVCMNFKFDFVFVHQYPSCDWDWSKLSLRGDMTIGQANKILSALNHKIPDFNQVFDNPPNSYYEKKNAKSLMKYFDNLMLQPWMNSWFIKTHIKDKDDKRFYLRKLHNCYEGRSKKRNELLWKDILTKAMSGERLFYWYLDNYELDNLFVGLLPDDHPRAKPEYQIRPGIYPSEKLKL